MIATITKKKYYQLDHIWKTAFKMKGSVALWKSPRESDKNLLIDLSSEVVESKTKIPDSEIGFLISPFLNKSGEKTSFLRADALFTSKDNKKWELVGGKRRSNIDKSLNKYTLENKPPPYHKRDQGDDQMSNEKKHFIDLVNKSVRYIKRNEFEKVVIARTFNKDLGDDFDILTLFDRLSVAYQDAFVSLVSIPNKGTWIGATPELLTEYSKKYFRTVSVAGTQQFPNDKNLSDAAWTQKEIREQAMVSRYIVDQFKRIRLRQYIETGPHSVRAGNMIHLKSEFSVDLEKKEFPGLGVIMKNLLHPTSAVCGMPKLSALQFIEQNEHLNRGLYSGYLGPVNMGGISKLYVNLRCMQLFDQSAKLYAGAGITFDSIPEREWDETTLKCHTLLDVMDLG